MPSLAAAVDGVAFGIITIDGDGSIQSWNEGARRLFGYSADEMIGKSITELERSEPAVSLARGYLDEKVYFHKDGHVVDATIEHTPIAGDDSETIGFMLIARPGVSMVRHPSQRVVEAESIAQIGSFEIDIRRDYSVWSDELYRIFGLDPQTYDPNVRGAIEFVHPADRDALREAIRRAVQESVPAELDYRVIRPDGEARIFCLRARLLRDADDRAARLLGTVQDITDRRRREHEAIIAGRFRTSAALGAGVAHSINNPLAAIVSSLEFARREVALLEGPRAQIEEIVESLGDARQASHRIRDIVRDLKIFSRAEQRYCEMVDVKEVLDAAVDLLRHEVEARAKVTVSYGPEQLVVYANPGELAIVFANLLANAADAIPLEAPDQEIEVRAEAAGDLAVVTIRDTGAGIPPDVAARIFDPFFTTKPTTAPGLGLAICRSVVTALGGTIRLDSPGKGTTCRVTLPRIASSTPEERTHVPSARRRLEVCVIDDDPQLLSGLERALVRDHEVVAITRSPEVLARIRAGQRFDVIVCDLMMPELGGMELHAELERLDPEQARRMVFMSGGALTEATSKFLDAVANRRVEKPFAIRTLLALIDELGK